MKRPIINNEIEAVVKIKSFQQIKVQDQMASLVSSDTFREKLIPILLKIFQNMS